MRIGCEAARGTRIGKHVLSSMAKPGTAGLGFRPAHPGRGWRRFLRRQKRPDAPSFCAGNGAGKGTVPLPPRFLRDAQRPPGTRRRAEIRGSCFEHGFPQPTKGLVNPVGTRDTLSWGGAQRSAHRLPERHAPVGCADSQGGVVRGPHQHGDGACRLKFQALALRPGPVPDKHPAIRPAAGE